MAIIGDGERLDRLGLRWSVEMITAIWNPG